jgi:methionyl-tRNA formyltransferase
MTRVVLFSYGPVIAPLRALLAEVGGMLVALVVPSNRPAEALAAAEEAGSGVPLLTQPPRSEVDRFAQELRALGPELFLVWHYSMLLPPSVLAVPRLGCVNVHGGLLPDYRGGHVLQWAILNGERETGVTLHYVDESIDTGPVIAEARIQIDDRDDAASLSIAIRDTGLRLLGEQWGSIASGDTPTIPQPAGGSYWPLRTETDGEIDWSDSAVQIRNLVRALVKPWPGATFHAGGHRITVDRADIVDLSGEPGTVMEIAPDRLVVAAREQAVAIRAARLDDRLAQFDELGVAVGDRLPS